MSVLVNPHRFARPVWTPIELDVEAWYDAADAETILGAAGARGILDVASLPINPNTGKPWQVGDKYRLMFSSSSLLAATAKTVSTYDSHVQADATAAGLGTGWKALVSCPYGST